MIQSLEELDTVTFTENKFKIYGYSGSFARDRLREIDHDNFYVTFSIPLRT